jgi:hypothetical protein
VTRVDQEKDLPGKAEMDTAATIKTRGSRIGEDVCEVRQASSPTHPRGQKPLFWQKNSRNSGAVCPICEFQTSPPHDGRTHRNQKKKAPFSAAELKEKGLVKV